MTKTEYENVPGTENDVEKDNLETPRDYGYGVRHVQAFLFFTSLALGYLSRGHLSVTIVAMTDVAAKETFIDDNYNKTIVLNTNDSLLAFDNGTKHMKDLQNFLEAADNNKSILENRSSILDTNITFENNRSFTTEDKEKSKCSIYRTYNWPKSTQEMVLGAFFLGYFIMMFPSGFVVQRWGGKLLIQIALLINGVIAIVTPWLTSWGGWKVLCACRLVQGLSQAGLYPAVHTMLANWVPVSERGTLSAYVYTGSGFGTIVAFQLGGVLADSRWGWPSTFWVNGLMCLLGFLLLTMFGADKPTDHKSVSEQEKSYINGNFSNFKNNVSKTPWKEVFTSKHAWACISGHVGSGVSFVFFLTQFPTYMHAILHFNIKSSGLLSSLPYMFTVLSTILFGHLSDFCTNRKFLSISNARKIFNTIGGVGSALCITAVAFTQDSTFAVFLFTVMLSFHSAGHVGFMVNYIDLAPNFSGALMAFGNTLCNSMIICLPLVVSSIVTDVKNPYQWKIVFLLVAGLAFIANVFYVLFTSVDIQSWNNDDNGKEAEEIKLEEYPEERSPYARHGTGNGAAALNLFKRNTNRSVNNKIDV